MTIDFSFECLPGEQGPSAVMTRSTEVAIAAVATAFLERASSGHGVWDRGVDWIWYRDAQGAIELKTTPHDSGAITLQAASKRPDETLLVASKLASSKAVVEGSEAHPLATFLRLALDSVGERENAREVVDRCTRAIGILAELPERIRREGRSDSMGWTRTGSSTHPHFRHVDSANFHTTIWRQSSAVARGGIWCAQVEAYSMSDQFPGEYPDLSPFLENCFRFTPGMMGPQAQAMARTLLRAQQD